LGRKLTDQERADRAVLEAAFQRKVIRLARKHGWKVCHFHASIVGLNDDGSPIVATAIAGDAKGFPDLVCVKAGQPVLWIELKRELGQPSPEQVAWIALLQAAGQCAMIWRPSQMKQIEEVLRA
jgi:hypothetical protein